MISKVFSRSFKLEYIKGCYCDGSAEVLFVISKMTPYSIQSTVSRFINNKHPESLQKDPERSIQNHQFHEFEQLNSLGALSTDNNNKIW